MRNDKSFSRRRFLSRTAALTPGLVSLSGLADEGSGSFSIRSFGGNRRLLATPEGTPFFSIGFNHIDSSALRYPQNIAIWRNRYGSSKERWIKERVVPDLQAWGFNSIGWTQELVLREKSYHQYSQAWARDHYNWAGMPYFHALPFIENHQWKLGQNWPDVFSEEFALWCEYVAREHCASLADDPNLIGYFFNHAPLLVSGDPRYPKKKPWFSAEMQKSKDGLKKISATVRQYYKVTTAAIRQYDPNHLIFGDRYDLGIPLSDSVIDAAAGYVDAIAVNLATPVTDAATRMTSLSWRTGIPFIIADADHLNRPAVRMAGTRHDPAKYRSLIESMRDCSDCLGVNLCGGFVRNRIRRKGVYDEQENPDLDAVEGFKKVNGEITKWYRSYKS